MKKQFYVGVSCLILFLSNAGYAARISISPSDNKVTVPKVVSVFAEWVKDKGKKYDIGFNISNEYGKNIIVLANEIKCFRGGLQGALDGDKVMTLRAGELKKFTFVCKLGGLSSGDYRLVLTSIYENPSGDGKTLGKSIAQEVDWHVRIAN